MGRKEAINEAYNHLKNKGVIHTQKDVAEKMHSTQSNISCALIGKESVLTNRFLERFNRAFGNIFNYDWLCTGCGQMLVDPEELDEPQEEILKQKEKEIIFLRSQIEELRENNKFLRELIKNQKQI